ncbi:competence protein CoiA family protein [Metabacillus lacus]|uniref:competence protein CoiA family protein n=1 Tax=Metabacillus lacus TaxID=1983721 RepID=UPI0012B02483
MFTATLENGKLFSLLEKNYSRTQLEIFRNTQRFYCPHCRQQLQLKLGSMVRYHFAHVIEAGCNYGGEGESTYHQAGKKQLFQWLQEHGVECVLESYLKRIKQRPDILLPGRSAIEYQCSSISTNDITKRSRMFERLGLNVYWILAASSLNRTAASSFMLSGMQWLFLNKCSSSIYLPFYCPQSQRLLILSDIIPFSKRKAAANLHIYPLSSITPYRRFIQDKGIPGDWHRFIRRYRSVPLLHPSTEEKLLHKELYQTMQLPMQYIPSLAMFPLRTGCLFESSCYVWQTRILLYIERHKTFTENDLILFMKACVDKKLLSVRNLPFVKDIDFSAAVLDYLHILKEYKVLVENKGGCYVCTGIPWGRGAEDLQKRDSALFSNLD